MNDTEDLLLVNINKFLNNAKEIYDEAILSMVC